MRHNVLIPKLPAADELLPYLRRIDGARWYSNGGPLVQELERRMGGLAVSSATLGLELAAHCIFRGRVRIPAFTFVATATALLRAGLKPVLCDVDETWALSDIDEDSMPVCPFGACVAPGGLVDAAAGWGNQAEGVRVYSLHATKSLPAGEGGMIVGPPELLDRISKLRNFGLDGSMVSEAGTNAKMSEYHAAVGLASLDAWEETKEARLRLAAAYRERLGDDIVTLPNAGVQASFPVLVDNAQSVVEDMASRGIETRRWYTPTLDRHPAFAHLEREGDLTGIANAHAIAERLLCLPFHLHLTERDVDEICDVFAWAVDRNTPKRLFERAAWTFASHL